MILRGYKEMPAEIDYWRSLDSCWWHGVWWHHITHQTYACIDMHGAPVKSNDPAYNLRSEVCTSVSCEVDPSINLVLDATIRALDYWEPE